MKLTLNSLSGEIISELSMADVYGNGGINPPFIYSIASKENEVAVGVGNGYACIFECNGKLIGKENWLAHNERIMGCCYEKSAGLLATACNSDLALWQGTLRKRVSLEHKVKPS